MISTGAKFVEKIVSIHKTGLSKEEFVNLIGDNKISLYRFAKSILKNDVQVEDAIGETILKAYKSRNRLNSIDSFKPWIMRILANECYNLIKKNNKFELVEDLETLNLVHIDGHETSMRDIVNKLSKEFSSVLVLFYYEDMSIKEISKVLNISDGTVKSRLNRAKSKLKVLLKEEL